MDSGYANYKKKINKNEIQNNTIHYVAYISFSIDNSWVGTIPAGDGFHARGQFEGQNIWAGGDIMAPFDNEVYVIEYYIFYKLPNGFFFSFISSLI